MKKSLWALVGIILAITAAFAEVSPQEPGKRPEALASAPITPAQLEAMLGQDLGADTVLGKPVEINKVILIPVVTKMLAFGMGNRSDTRTNTAPTGQAGKHEEKGGELSGGFGYVRPVSLIVIKADGAVEIQNLQSNFLLGLVEKLMPLIRDAIEKRFEMFKWNFTPPAPGK